MLKARAEQYRLDGFHVVIVGDLNVAHKAVDHCEANLITDFDKQPHRLWMDELLNDGFVDCFRRFHPDERHAYTVWNTQVAFVRLFIARLLIMWLMVRSVYFL